MKKALLIIIVVAASFCLSGCVVAAYEEHGPRHRHTFHGHPGPVIEVIEVPGPPPGPYRHHHRPHGWR